MDPLSVAQAVVGSHILLKAETKPSWKTRPFVIWNPLQDMYEETLKAYETLLKKFKQDVKDSLGLAKAVTKPALSPKEVLDLAKLIRDYHTAFIIQIGAGDMVDPAEAAALVTKGILPPTVLTVIEDAYLYGQLIASVRSLSEKDDLKSLSYKQIKDRMKAKPIPLSAQEKRAIAWSKHSAAVHIAGLGNRLADEFSSQVITADAEYRHQTMGKVYTALQENIEDRKTVRQLASALGDATEEWSRDLGRIAATEKQTAFQEGFTQKLIAEEDEDPEHIYVAKIPKPNACPACLRLHMTAGIGSVPRIFALSTLIDNGTNRGKKQADWQAVVGTVHPWCACELVHVPPGWAFEDEPASSQRGYKKVKGKRAWMTKKGKPWRPRLVPDSLRRGDIFKRDLMKSFMTYGDSVPEHGVVIRVGDPEIVAEIERVIHESPPEIFHKDVGVTLITTDHPRPMVALEEHDLAYWTGNEVRISTELPKEKVAQVLRHELGHSLNVYLIRKWGGEKPVREWHDALYEISKDEGFVSAYAKTLPIENAAETTRLYLYERRRLMLEFPRTFAFLHTMYRQIVRPSRAA
jgi:hypothetical protein